MKIWFGLVEAFNSYHGNKKKKKKITDPAQFNILMEFSFRADNKKIDRKKITDTTQINTLGKILFQAVIIRVKDENMPLLL